MSVDEVVLISKRRRRKLVEKGWIRLVARARKEKLCIKRGHGGFIYAPWLGRTQGGASVRNLMKQRKMMGSPRMESRKLSKGDWRKLAWQLR